MFSKIVTLELAKQKKSFLGALLIFALTLIVVNLEGVARHRNLVESLSAVLAISALGGIPLLAIIFGLSAASGLREESPRKAEEMLPFSPVKRVFGAYLTSLLYLISSSLLMILMGLAFGSISHLQELSDTFLSLAWVFPALVIHLHLLTFVLAYWIRQPVLATGLASLLIGLETYLTWSLIRLSEMKYVAGFSSHMELTFLWIVIVIMAAFIGAMVMLIPFSKRIDHENKISIPLGVLASLLILSSVPSFYLILERSTHKFETQLSPFWYPWFHQELKDPIGGPAITRGMLVQTVSGDLVRIDGKKRELLYRSTASPFRSDFNGFYQNSIFLSSHFTQDGGFWALLQPDELNRDLYQIWTSKLGGPFRLVTSFRSSVDFQLLAAEKGEVNMYGIDRGDIFVSSRVPKPGMDPEVVPIESSPRNTTLLYATYARRMETWIHTGKVATLDSDHGTLTQLLDNGGKKTWDFSAYGRAIPWEEAVIGSTSPKKSNCIPQLFQNDAGSAFAFVVEQKDGRHNVVVCMPDGSIKTPWNHPGISEKNFWRRTIPGGGTAWRQKADRSLIFVTSPDGEFYPPLELAKLQQSIGLKEDNTWIDFRRMEAGKLWTLIGDHFVLIDLHTSQIVKNLGSVASNDENYYWNVYTAPTEEGVYFIQDDHIFLIDWNGKKQDLGPAYL